MTWPRLIILFLVPISAHALPNLEYEYLGGGQDSSSTLTLDGDFPQRPGREDSFNWLLMGGTSKSESVSSTNTPSQGQDITDTTLSAEGGLGYKSAGLWTIDGSYSYDDTPDETLIDRGPTLAIGKTWKFGDGKPEDFQPRFNLKLMVGQLTYIETFGSGRVRRRKGATPLPVTGDNSIEQRVAGFSTYVKPWEWFRAKFDYKTYSYSKDVNSFLQYLDTQNRRAVGLNNAVSGFSHDELRLEFDFYADVWELDLSEDWTRVEADGSLTTTYKAVVYRDLGEKWRVGLGGEQILSTSPENPTAENELYLSVAYEF